VLLTGRIALAAGVHREASRAIKPDLIFRPSEQLQKRKAVSRRTVAQAAAFDQWAGMPRELARGDEQVVDARISEIRQGIHDSWCAVTVLDKDGVPARAVPSLRLRPVDELSLVNGTSGASAIGTTDSKSRRAHASGVGHAGPAGIGRANSSACANLRIKKIISPFLREMGTILVNHRSS
jgi:hypothetical protein